ncbi:MAG: hypothetical protein PHT53_00415 [Candidatus Omnitrophica bacterium]|nr:hypothetical protein [Candidatus Omnitrophota bacterium]
MRKLLFLFIIFLTTHLSFLNARAETVGNKVNQGCDCIWGIKSIIVDNNTIIVEFQRTYHMAYCRQKDGGVVGIDKEIPFSLNVGETLELIGDHERELIKLRGIKGETASLYVTNEHRPPPGVGRPKRHTIECEILEKWKKQP